MFVLSFWAVTQVGSTIRAALDSLLALAGLGACAVLGSWCGAHLGRVEALPLLLATAHYQLPPNFFEQHGLAPYFVALFIAAVAVTALVQSLSRFRRSATHRWVLLRHLAVLAALAIFISSWCLDWQLSSTTYRNHLQWTLSAALTKLTLKAPNTLTWRDRVVPRPLDELKGAGGLSGPATAWLRNARIISG